MGRPARLKDVAADTGFSETTISRYLNNSINLPDSTCRRIDEAVVRLGYRPNPQARSLSRGRSDQIGLVIPDLGNPFFAQVAAMVERAAAARGLGVLLCTTSNQRERELDYLRRLQQNQIDALLFVTNHGHDAAVAAAINAATGVVLLDEDVIGTVAPKIFAENEHGAWLATAHLLEHSHRAIAIINGPKGLMSAQERACGVRQAVDGVEGAHVTVEYPGAYSREHGRLSAARLLLEHPETTAVFTANDEILVGLLEVFRDQGVAVPKQISVITFDDVEPLHLFSPPISAIRQDVARMGQRAVEVSMASPRKNPPTSIVERIAIDLVLRASVTRPRRGP
jgi:LacI family transcriptional regulator